ncbi:MAG: hypothetical protein ACRDL7_07245 [Gaiellaceae bacterium]
MTLLPTEYLLQLGLDAREPVDDFVLVLCEFVGALLRRAYAVSRAADSHASAE